MTYDEKELATVRAEMGRGEGNRPVTRQIGMRTRGVGSPERSSRPDAQSSKYEWFRLHFATTRNRTGADEPAKAFGDRRSDEMTLGTVDVSIPAAHRMGRLESPSIVRFEWSAQRDRHLMLAPTYTQMKLEDWKQLVAREANSLEAPGVLLFIHGYNTSFGSAALRAAQLGRDLTFSGPVVLFSWPSAGLEAAYPRDEQQARNAIFDMANLLDELSKSVGGERRITVIAHSMGNQVFTAGLGELLRRRAASASAFSQIVLAAPDVSVEEFRQRWRYVLADPQIQRRFTLYASSEDFPIWLSEQARGEPRIGSGGKQVAVFPPMATVDASKITKEWFGLAHSYFADNTTLLSDLYSLIHHQLPAGKRFRHVQATTDEGDVYWVFQQ